MKFDSIKSSEALPVKKFEVEGLGSLVFLAGPNGIGKSRLIDFILTYIRNPKTNPKVNFIVSVTSQSFKSKAAEELRKVSELLSESYIREKVVKYHTIYQESLSSDEWKCDIPGKQIFSIFCNKVKMDENRLKTLYIKNALSKDNGPLKEIIDIFSTFSS